jgi:general secretion pathway protein K
VLRPRSQCGQTSRSLAETTLGNRFTALRGRAYTVRVEFQHAGRADRSGSSVLRLTENPNEPFWVLNWKTK